MVLQYRRDYGSLRQTAEERWSTSTDAALLGLEDRPKLLTKLRSIDVTMNIHGMHGSSTNDFFFLPGDHERTTGLTWHFSAIDTLAWHTYLR